MKHIHVVMGPVDAADLWDLRKLAKEPILFLFCWVNFGDSSIFCWKILLYISGRLKQIGLAHVCVGFQVVHLFLIVRKVESICILCIFNDLHVHVPRIFYTTLY